MMRISGLYGGLDNVRASWVGPPAVRPHITENSNALTMEPAKICCQDLGAIITYMGVLELDWSWKNYQ